MTSQRTKHSERPDESTSTTSTHHSISTPEKLLEVAPQILEELEEDSPFFAAHPPRSLPRFNFSEFTLGNELGAGSFGQVNEILSANLSASLPEPKLAAADEGVPSSQAASTPRRNSSHCEDDDTFDEVTCRKFLCSTVLRPNLTRDGKMDTRYAVKRVIPSLEKSEHAKGIVDIAIEARFLAALSHPNIVRIRGLGAGSSLSPSFFIVMDRLHDILDSRIAAWRNERDLCSGRFCGLWGTDKDALSHLWAERLLVCVDVTSALRFLHKNSIVYRDIKPENIGFDVRGNVKIFDFGLAKELRSEDKRGDNYNITGRTGSFPYMAPEVATYQPYNLKADSYSFGFLMWEICALEQPFPFFTAKEMYQKVTTGGYRPTIRRSWPSQTKKLIKQCWDAKPSKRCNMEQCADLLRGDYSKYATEIDGKKPLVNRSIQLADNSTRSMRTNLKELAESLQNSNPN